MTLFEKVKNDWVAPDTFFYQLTLNNEIVPRHLQSGAKETIETYFLKGRTNGDVDPIRLTLVKPAPVTMYSALHGMQMKYAGELDELQTKDLPSFGSMPE